MPPPPPPLVQIGMHWFPQTAGGLDRYFTGLSGALHQAGVPFRALALGHGEPPFAEVTFVARANASAPRRLAAFRGAMPASTSLVATHFALYALPLLDHLARAPHVVHFHGPWAGESSAEHQSPLRSALKHAVERLVYATATRFIVLSEAFRRELAHGYKIPDTRIDVIPGGIDATAFDPPLTPSEARAQLNWPSDRPIILCVRRLARRMGLDVLLQAIHQLRAAHPDVLLMIAGQGSLHAELSAQIEALDLRDHARLLGFVPDADLPVAYRAAHCTVVPSQSLEGFGLVTLESLASGTPALVTPVGGLPETVGSLDANLVLPGLDAASISAGLARALDGGSLPDMDACRTHVRTHFDWAQVLPRILATYAAAAAEK